MDRTVEAGGCGRRLSSNAIHRSKNPRQIERIIIFKTLRAFHWVIFSLWLTQMLGAVELDFANRSEVEGAVSDNGTITLRWESDSELEVILQQSSLQSFEEATVRYEGTDGASVLTGLAEGSHYFRLGTGSGEWSPPLEVRIEFFPRGQLTLLLSLGGVVVLATVGAIVGGYCQAVRGEEA